jgi:hypothetical protein
MIVASMKFDRRTMLALPLLATLSNRPPAPGLADDIAKYVSFGVHRVGTAGEKKTASWLKRRLEQMGYTSRIDSFPVATMLNPAVRLRAGGEDISAFPQWNVPPTALGTTMSAPLHPLQAEAGAPSIRFLPDALGFAANWNPAFDRLVAEAEAKGAIALIMAVDIASGELFACNQHSREPLPVPVIMVAKHDLPKLKAQTGQQASLHLAGKPVVAKALNVIGEKPGTGQRIVISTPLTGWFQCGGERGPGIALWLRLAKQLARTSRPVTLLGTGSHELGHFGIEHALNHGAPPPDDVALWLHFGASLAATRLDAQFAFKSPQYLVGLPESEARAKAAFQPQLPIYVTGDNKTQGEAGPIIASGYRNFIGMSGMFPTFHTPVDLGQAVDYARLEAIARAAEALVDEV